MTFAAGFANVAAIYSPPRIPAPWRLPFRMIGGGPYVFRAIATGARALCWYCASLELRRYVLGKQRCEDWGCRQQVIGAPERRSCASFVREVGAE